ncbi:MAG: Fic family protein [Actinomycetota bacterium]|nr:Fic family protein [Actinomycetota bacterium]MDQ2981599.1 Fic family protein [Actinomycetota bacterium]
MPDNDDLRVIELIDALREEMKSRVGETRRWSGSLRRMLEARAVQASNSIEGYNATLSDVVATADGEQPMEADEATRQALIGYREAMTYVLQLSQDGAVVVDEGLLKSLHFMMLKHDLSKNPGRWRPGAIYVRREGTGEIVYEGPSPNNVPTLIESALGELENAEAPALVRAAMAHLNLMMIHPFSDGNGRMARCLQTLVLAREQIVAPVFSSIEEYLGRNTGAYYDIFARTGEGKWSPTNDARPWVRFCLTAHYRQAKSVLRRVQAFEAMWQIALELAREHRLPERCVGPISEAAYGLRVRRATYVANVEITYGERIPDLTASRDLKALVNAGLFDPIGDTKGRYYLATDRLKGAWERARNTRPPHDTDDPYDLVARADQLELATP